MHTLNPLEASLGRFFNIGRGEIHSALLMALFFFLAIASVSLIKAVQTGLYVIEVGVDYRLPLIYIALAILSGPLVLLYRGLSKKYSLILLASCTIVLLILSLIVFWFLLSREEKWVYVAFYSWGLVYAVVLPTQGWFFSYGLYQPRAARRIFALLGAGGILGGVVACYYTWLVVELIGFRWLLAHSFILLIGLQMILLLVHHLNRKKLRRPAGSIQAGAATEGSGAFKSTFKSPNFRSLAALVIAATLTSTLVDLLYKKALDLHFTDSSPDELTQFFAVVLGTIFVASAAFQVLGTTRILRSAGLGVGLLVLPLALSLASVTIIMADVIIAAAFLAVVATKVIDDSLRRSVDRTSFELLYVPMPGRQRIMFKGMMELVIARLGDGLGATVFLVLITVSDEPMIPTAFVILVAAGIWVCLTLKVKEDYVQTLRRTLAFRKITALGTAPEIDEAVADHMLVGALESRNADKVHFALERLINRPQSADDDEGMMMSDLSTDSLDMDVTGIYKTSGKEPRWLNSVKSLIRHKDDRVAAAAIRLMTLHRPSEYQSLLKNTLADRKIPEKRFLVYLIAYEEDLKQLLVPESVLRWSESAAEEQAVLLARIIGKSRNARFLPLLENWLEAASRPVRREAIRALGHYTDPVYIPVLLEHLEHSWSRRAARRALISYGDPVVPELIRLLQDPKANLSVKREVPFILTRINTRSSRAGLVASLYTHDSVVSYRALKGLNAIRDISEELSYSQESFIPLLQMWAKEYYQLINIEASAQKEKRALSALLSRVLDERKDWVLEKIFRGLELYLPIGDAYFSYVGYKGDDPELRENAVELIYSRIRGELRQTLLPLFSDKPQSEVAFEGQALFQLPSTLEDALSEGLFGGDPWFKCTIIVELAHQMTQNWKERVSQALEDISPLVRETARWALKQ